MLATKLTIFQVSLSHTKQGGWMWPTVRCAAPGLHPGEPSPLMRTQVGLGSPGLAVSAWWLRELPFTHPALHPFLFWFLAPDSGLSSTVICH